MEKLELVLGDETRIFTFDHETGTYNFKNFSLGYYDNEDNQTICYAEFFYYTYQKSEIVECSILSNKNTKIADYPWQFILTKLEEQLKFKYDGLQYIFRFYYG